MCRVGKEPFPLKIRYVHLLHVYKFSCVCECVHMCRPEDSLRSCSLEALHLVFEESLTGLIISDWLDSEA